MVDIRVDYIIYPYKGNYSIHKEIGSSPFSLNPVVEGDWDGFTSRMSAISMVFEDIREEVREKAVS